MSIFGNMDLNLLAESGIILRQPESQNLGNRIFIPGAGTRYEERDPEAMNALHAANIVSRVNPEKTLLAHQLKLLRSFKTRFDTMVRQLRETGDIDQKNFTKLKQICVDPEFDFLMPIPGQPRYRSNALSLILAFSRIDPESSINKELDYMYIDSETENKITEHFKRAKKELCIPCGQKISTEDLEQITKPIDYIEPIVPAYRSYAYTNTATELALELLEIAQNKRTEFNLVRNGHPIFDNDETKNLIILNWFVNNSSVISPSYDSSALKTQREILKLKVVLNSIVDLNDQSERSNLSPNYIEERLNNIKLYFKASINQKLQFWGHTQDDAVILLLENSTKLPEKFVLELLQYAKSQGYNFATSYREYQKSKYNLLNIYVEDNYDATGSIPSVNIVKFLLDNGVNPFEESAVSSPEDESINIRDLFDEFIDILVSDDTDRLIDFLSDKDFSYFRTPFETNLYLLDLLLKRDEEQEIAVEDGNEDEVIDYKEITQEAIQARKEIARLMLEKRP